MNSLRRLKKAFASRIKRKSSDMILENNFNYIKSLIFESILDFKF
jgi:hypothetical protein